MANNRLTSLYKGRHRFRERRLCRGNAEYERLMAEAKAEYDAKVEAGLIPRGKATAKQLREHPELRRAPKHFRGMRVNDKVRNTA